MAAELISVNLIILSLIGGIVIGLLTMATGNHIWKIFDIFALIIIIFGLMAFIPQSNSNTNVQQAVNQITDLLYYFVNVVLPFLVSDAAASAGYAFVTGGRD